MKMKKLFTDGTYTVDVSNGMEDMYKILKEVWDVSPNQIYIDYNEENKYWEVKLRGTNKLFGALNFNPDEN